ncbi:MAG: MgtC/SapB family protein [Thermodesulfovibrionales bacterium]
MRSLVSAAEIIVRLLLGTLLGGIIGFERQAHGRAAGFRTQLLVCVACVLLMLISEGYQQQGAAWPRPDPLRIAAGAMTGVGFLGAGVILKIGVSVQGLTTAACIWIVSAIGLAVGAGQYVAALTGFAITFTALWLLRIAETRMPRLIYKNVQVTTDDSGDQEKITEIFTSRGYAIGKIDYAIDLADKERRFAFSVSTRGQDMLGEIIGILASLPAVRKVDIRSQ